MRSKQELQHTKKCDEEEEKKNVRKEPSEKKNEERNEMFSLVFD